MLRVGTAYRWRFYLIVGLIGSATGCASLRPEVGETKLNQALEPADSRPYPTAVPKAEAASFIESAGANLPRFTDVPDSRGAIPEPASPAKREPPLANPASVPPPKPINLQPEQKLVAPSQPLASPRVETQPVAVERPAIPAAAPTQVAPEKSPAPTPPQIVTPVTAGLEAIGQQAQPLPLSIPQHLLEQHLLEQQVMPALNALSMTTPSPSLAMQLTAPPSAIQVPVAIAAATSHSQSDVPVPAADLADLTRRLDELTDVLESEVRRRRSANEKDVALPRLEQQLRLMYVLAGRTEPAATGIDSLPEPEREAYRHVLFGLSTWLSEDEATRAAMRNAKVLRSLREAASELSSGSKLDLSHLTFCEKVEYFGWYTEFPRSEFKPKQQVILYVEVDNFAAEEKGPQAFETELQGAYQIFDGSGGVVDERKLPLDREVCRNYRRDYFLAYRIYLPAEIADGAYRLELTIEDLKAKSEFKGRKLGQAMIDFSIRN